MRAVFVRVSCLTCGTSGTGVVHTAKKVTTLGGITCVGHCLRMIAIPVLSDEWIAARRLLEIKHRQSQERSDLLLQLVAGVGVAN